jgi:uncharacterized protein (DUF779 family)
MQCNLCLRSFEDSRTYIKRLNNKQPIKYKQQCGICIASTKNTSSYTTLAQKSRNGPTNVEDGDTINLGLPIWISRKHFDQWRTYEQQI